MGAWRDAEISYLHANRTACDLCGHPIARRYWEAEVDGVKHVFCSPEHERMYVSYWLPRHGTAATR
jgi:hypothetical protein